MRSREEYLHEVRSRFTTLFKASRDGHRIFPAQRHRLEGFIQAGSFIGLADGLEMKAIMEQTHRDVFGTSIADRSEVNRGGWPSETIDYTEFEYPTFERKK